MDMKNLYVWAGTGMLIGVCTVTAQAQGSIGVSVAKNSLRSGISSAVSRSVSSSLNSSARQLLRQAQQQAVLFHPVLPQTLSPQQESMLRCIFQSRETTTQETNLFSGAVFQTVYNGRREVYGVVASHALESGQFVLGKTFTADIYEGEGRFRSVPVQVVQVSAPSMLDVSLVKFRPEDEILFRPLTISPAPFLEGNTAVSFGFADRKLVEIDERTFRSATPLCRRTTMPYPRADRMGLCGSALVNEQGELIGIHTGSTYGKTSEQDDVGHATNASLLNVLVEAYHNDGQATFPLILNQQKVLDMRVDEYISYIRLYDENGKQLWQRGFESKFAYDNVNTKIAELAPRVVELTVRRVHWDPAHPDNLVEIRNSRDKTRRTYQYDFQEGKLTFISKSKEDPRER